MITIEKLSASNLDSATDILFEFQIDHYQSYGRYYTLKKNAKEKIHEILKIRIKQRNTKMLISFDGKAPIGYIFLRIEKNIPIYQTSHYGYIGGLYIKPNYRKKGYAKQLIEEAFKWFVHRKVPYVELKVDNNNPAQNFWKSLGFNEQQTIQVKYL